ncbi:alpha/beta hydrolase [Ramlibacter sp. XY19]|uniref:alpha/beta fold hydrolase n=1 Tax=Ramlibacter paludis TaxID=2908000 RepID=UPI0023DAC417|nr:alpha/beta hydrolase [Ramlibacter paludis]MCG2592661.1 alpha/beta hydrolase [Ramlibacter paludis]
MSLPAEALRLLALATRHATPCGDGEVVWHAWGDPRTDPLVLLHGGSGSWMHWIRNVEALAAAGRWVLVPDLPGFGDSAVPPGNKDADGVVDPIAEGIVALTGSAPVDLVGFSFGGLSAGLLAAAHPQRVHRLVLVGAPGLGIRDRRLPLTAWRHLEDEDAQLRAHRRNLATLMLYREESIDDLAVAVQAANVPRDRMQRRRLAMTDALSVALQSIRCPVDAIYGDHDALYVDKLPELEARLREGPTFRELVYVPGAGHWAQYEAAAAFDRALLRLLSH